MFREREGGEGGYELASCSDERLSCRCLVATTRTSLAACSDDPITGCSNPLKFARQLTVCNQASAPQQRSTALLHPQRECGKSGRRSAAQCRKRLRIRQRDKRLRTALNN
jgi:hypothetical protein